METFLVSGEEEESWRELGEKNLLSTVYAVWEPQNWSAATQF